MSLNVNICYIGHHNQSLVSVERKMWSMSAIQVLSIYYIAGTPEELPFDAYTDKRKRMAHHERGQLLDPAKLAMRKFLANDRKVLRFYGLWDDRQTLYGEIHRMVHLLLCQIKK